MRVRRMAETGRRGAAAGAVALAAAMLIGGGCRGCEPIGVLEAGDGGSASTQGSSTPDASGGAGTEEEKQAPRAAADEDAGGSGSPGSPRAKKDVPKQEKLLARSRRGFGPADVSLSEQQLERTGAEAAHTYESREPPLLIYVLEYDSPESAAEHVPKVTAWINSTGLVHHGESVVNRRYVVIAGSPDPKPMTEAQKKAANDFIDGFMRR